MDVIIYQRILAHYRVEVFNKLNLSTSKNLVVAHGQKYNSSHIISGERNKARFERVKLSNKWLREGGMVWQNWRRVFEMSDPSIVIAEHNPRIISLYPLIVFCKQQGIPIVLWGHGGSRKREVDKSNNLKDYIHRGLIRVCDGYICYNGRIKSMLSNFVNRKKLFVANNTLDTERLTAIRRKLENNGKNEVKKNLNLRNKNYALFIGRIISDKRVGRFIDIIKNLQKEVDIGGLIIGDGPKKHELERRVKNENIEDIYFLGAISEWKKSAPYIYAADVLLNPGYIGLSANHAMCFGTPVITIQKGKDGPYHSPEIEHIDHGNTGIIVKKDNIHTLSRAVKQCIDRNEYFYKRTTSSVEKKLSVKNMVRGFQRCIKKLAVDS
ncbi:glycosyltransferase [Salinibacter ruber]|uniref:glycosyltransferase n=1 Tax=Salinibacter ruber TaxID=146919 RepID=UPI002166F205|nr:glycosyltransferase [Salinibacter ruber]MCS4098006.1 glycosyltransferase involved in cell wall biosynthesis [Salinibacter ruber]